MSQSRCQSQLYTESDSLTDVETVMGDVVPLVHIVAVLLVLKASAVIANRLDGESSG